ncbi:hypothetical protein NP493_210g03001 [Ridgeia piscesae]|uniref:Nuclear cap-binding protein subunit 3 n=1 Tax=Ridgeia piscesae TaxID=27915 RepID=A0AAD9P157_RIDPI|nr:hypothetical protein NP493_210g03001 [Ridgeia piscesae]
MAARESEDADIMTTISVPNTNDISDDEEMSDTTEKKGVGHNRRGVSPIHVPAEWGKAEPTGDDDPESLERRQQRAKRFGVSASETEEKSAGDLDLDSLYKSLGVSTRGEERLRVEGIRDEAIHIRGIDNMTTQDVFHFFKDFNPGSIEWIDETSCNVMWLDDETSARALLKLTYDVEHVPEFSELGQTSKPAVKVQEEGMDVDASGGTGWLASGRTHFYPFARLHRQMCLLKIINRYNLI